jgi:hypothetical protein
VASPVLLSGEVINAQRDCLRRNVKEAIMNADLMQRPAIGWIVFVAEEDNDDWSGVYDCGAIFKPEERIFLVGDRDDWPLEQCS